MVYCKISENVNIKQNQNTQNEMVQTDLGITV